MYAKESPKTERVNVDVDELLTAETEIFLGVMKNHLSGMSQRACCQLISQAKKEN